MPRLPKVDWLLDSLTSPVILFENLTIMEEALERYRLYKYVVHEFDCTQHLSRETMFNAVLHALSVLGAEYTYENIQIIQFWDLLRYVEIPDDTGIVLAFKNFDDFYQRLPESGQHMLISIAREHFHHLSYGLRLLTCVHSTNSFIESEPLLTIRLDRCKYRVFTEEADIGRCQRLEYREAEKELRLWIESHVGHEVEWTAHRTALFDVTGTADVDSLVALELDAPQMIELLQGYDFSRFKIAGDEK